jgi:hypothetical protein
MPPALRSVPIKQLLGRRQTFKQVPSETLTSDGLIERVHDVHGAGRALSRSMRKEIKALLRGGYSHAKVMQDLPIDS